MRTLILPAVLATALPAQAATKAPFTPFDLVEGTIPVEAGHGIETGEQKVRLLVVDPAGGDVGVQEGCRVDIGATAISRLDGRRCAPLWRSPQPRSVVMSMSGTAIALRWDVIITRGAVGPQLELPTGKDAWAGYDRQKQLWVSWTDGEAVPVGVVAGLRAGQSTALYAKSGDAVEQWGVDTAGMLANSAPPEDPVGPPPVADPPPRVDPQPAPGPGPARPPRDAVKPPADKPPKPSKARPATQAEIDAIPAGSWTPAAPWRYGAWRVGVGAILGEAVDGGYGVRAVGGGQPQITRTKTTAVDLDLVVGYAPFLFSGGRSGEGCGRVSACIGPYVGLSVAGQGSGGVEWLPGVHLGVEAELAPTFALELTAVGRRITRLAEGAQLGGPAIAGEPAPTIETFGFGVGIVASATPRFGGR